MSSIRVHLYVTGKVQGVFFRQTLKVIAIQNGVYGWVRNLEDGRVEAIIEGDTSAVDTLVKWVHNGPANSRVTNVEVVPEEFTKQFTEFVVSY